MSPSPSMRLVAEELRALRPGTERLLAWLEFKRQVELLAFSRDPLSDALEERAA